MQVRICLFGHFGSPNFGNEITLVSILQHISSRLPGAEVACICTGPDALAAAQGIKTVPITRRFLKFWKPRSRLSTSLRRVLAGVACEPYRWFDAFKTLRGANMLIIPGTGLLTDAFGLLEWGPYSLFKWSLVARACRCKLMFLSVGAGPLYGGLGKYFVKSALSLAHYRSYRDPASLIYVKSIGFPTNSDRVCPDLAFGVPQTLLPLSRKGTRLVVGVGLMDYPGKYSVAEPSNATYPRYLESLVSFTTWLLERNYDVRLLIGEVCDNRVLDEFKALLKARLVAYAENRIIDERAASVEELLPQIAATDIVVATRFHNVLLALLLNKPVISISFHHKCASLMSQVGMAEYCEDINYISATKLIERFQELERSAAKLRPMIAERVEEARKALEEQYQLVFSSL
jgi:polysaccharide pyruvyl transferase WcaK-like protein